MNYKIYPVLIVLMIASMAQAQEATVKVSFADRLGAMNIDRMALGQGGLSDEPMWDSRIPEIRALHPRLIRLFIQDYFRLLPKHETYHFATLDRSVETILATGARPLMCLCFKPRLLFPEVNQDVVEPVDYQAWEQLIEKLVKHYRGRLIEGMYWEVANEPDIGESGGCPYRFRPANYVRYYQHTAAAIHRAEPEAYVGGPALASVRSPILPALLAAAEKDSLPLDFISWHIYSSSPASIRQTIDYAKGLLKKHPGLKPETILDEWNMDLQNPPLDPRFRPCYIAETIWQMKEAGLDWSCYYLIRDYHVDPQQFAPFMSPGGTAFMARWWNRMPQFDGLFDFQNTIRPSYFAFKLLSRLGGERLRVASSVPHVHGLAAHNEKYQLDTLLLWNFSPTPTQIDVALEGLPRKTYVRHLTLDAATASNDENHRLRPEPGRFLEKGNQRWKVQLQPYGVEYWSFE